MELGNNFNQSIDNLPQSLLYLKLGYNFAQYIHKLPNLLQFILFTPNIFFTLFEILKSKNFCQFKYITNIIDISDTKNKFISGKLIKYRKHDYNELCFLVIHCKRKIFINHSMRNKL